MNTNWKTLAIGVIIGLILMFIFPSFVGNLTFILTPLLATIYVGYAIRDNFNNSVFNGAIVSVILAIFIWIVSDIILKASNGAIDSAINLIYLIIYFSIFGAFGSTIGNFIKERKSSSKNIN